MTASGAPTPEDRSLYSEGGHAADMMTYALALAANARGRVSPNPAVGAVVVRDFQVVGQGCTQPPGREHAEIVALRQAGDRARLAGMFVTLEPCSYHGRTPACCEAIAAAGVAWVVCAMEDPNPRVSGAGIAYLRAQGVRVEVGSHEQEARALLADYIHHTRTGLPLVTAKFAASLDGKIGTRSGDSRWISGPETLVWAHEERTRIDAIAVGINTVLVDDPQLTARPDGEEGDARQPLRVVIDSGGRTPTAAHVLQGPARTLIATTARSSGAWRAAMAAEGAEVILLSDCDGHVDLRELVALLGRRDCLNLLVEGGGIILGSFFDQGLIDRVQAILAPMIIGGETAPTAVGGLGAERMANVVRLEDVIVTRLGADILVEGSVPR
jgi:diaminohydroxyphosphoribosylaminopyrimidine deaminase/5-amino-6-(5-phosphoribosylamino)uracil reductase